MIDNLVYTDETKRAIQIAQAIAKEYQHEHFTPAHLLRAALHEDFSLKPFLVTLGKDVGYLRDWADVRIEDNPKASRSTFNPSGSEAVARVMDEANTIQMKFAAEGIDLISLLAAISKPNIAFTSEQLKSFPLTNQEIIDNNIENSLLADAISGNPEISAPAVSKQQKIVALHKYCIDKTSLAREGKIDPIIARDRETRMMTEILGRRTKPNVLIVGEPGVGKTALVDGLALRVISERVAGHLDNAFVFELDIGALVAGASYKGEVEDRLKNIIKEVKSFDRAILFIDEIHLLLDSNGPVGTGAANLIKPELARGELTVIGATTQDEYRKYIEKEEAFSRRFEVLRVEEPDVTAATRMLKTLLPLYEKHHQIKVSEDVPAEAVILAQRYIKDRRLPDSAIDLIDRTMAAIRMADETSIQELEDLKKGLDQLKNDELSYNLAELRWFHRKLKDTISPILLSQLEDETDEQQLDTVDSLYQYLSGTINILFTFTEKKKGTVEKTDVAAVVAHKTGIPLGKIQTKEREKLLNMEEHLKERVIGQDHAVKAIADAILESRSGLTKAGQPIGSFFFLGPTGTGKTELAKSLAEFLFNDESTLIRFDMSEFKEEHSAAVLLGAPAGYVGYEEGGVLVNKIREKPYSVVLFDEIEKAHASVFDIFLQIMDEGKLHDRLGKQGDFSNAVILFTSNIGSRYILDEVEKGNLPTSQQMLEVMSGHFRPEFLARVTEMVPFSPIREENVVKIFEIHLSKLVKTLEKQGINLKVSDEAKKHLALSGFTPEYGARPLTGVIRNQLRRPISRMIVGGEVTKGAEIEVVLENDTLIFK